MKIKLTFSIFIILLLSNVSFAQIDSVGVGVGVGAAIPIEKDLATSFSWGFYVDIPLISTFHITPSAEVYQIKNNSSNSYTSNATDMTLSFKFIVPLRLFSLFVGVPVGVTNAQFTSNDANKAPVRPHVGVLGGVAFNIVSNIDLFGQVTYKVIMAEKENLNFTRVSGGFLFHF